MRHEGEEIGSGHYIVNFYNENMKKWEEVNDHSITLAPNYKQDNERGVIFMFQRISSFNENHQGNHKEKTHNQQNNHRTEDTYSSIAGKYKNKPPNLHNPRRNFDVEERSQPIHQELSNSRKTEKEKIELKKCNIIVRGIEEQSHENDIKMIIKMNHVMGNDNFNHRNIKGIERIGENYERGRPLKVELDSYMTKIQIMRNLHYLQEDRNFRNIKIQHDLTKSQMYEYRNLIQESIEQEQNDPTGRYKYRVRGPPGQWEIVRYTKNSD